MYPPRHAPRRWPGTAVLAAILLAACSPGASAVGETIDLCRYTRTFTEDFDALSVSASSNETARWSAHTPWSGDFGDAAFIDPILEFSDPERNRPFFVKNGVLTIRAQRGAEGKWTSGLLSSTDWTTAGFAQTYGYFEARMKMPPGPGTWPAFWLVANAKKEDLSPRVEIDVVEYYGHDTANYHSVLHVWDKVDFDKSRGEGFKTAVEPDALVKDFHTYGVAVDRENIVYYLDRREVGRHKTPPEHDKPLTVLLNLALGSGWPIDRTPDPSDLLVDYVHVYAPDAAAEGTCTGSDAG